MGFRVLHRHSLRKLHFQTSNPISVSLKSNSTIYECIYQNGQIHLGEKTNAKVNKQIKYKGF